MIRERLLQLADAVARQDAERQRREKEERAELVVQLREILGLLEPAAGPTPEPGAPGALRSGGAEAPPSHVQLTAMEYTVASALPPGAPVRMAEVLSFLGRKAEKKEKDRVRMQLAALRKKKVVEHVEVDTFRRRPEVVIRPPASTSGE